MVASTVISCVYRLQKRHMFDVNGQISSSLNTRKTQEWRSQHQRNTRSFTRYGEILFLDVTSSTTISQFFFVRDAAYIHVFDSRLGFSTHMVTYQCAIRISLIDSSCLDISLLVQSVQPAILSNISLTMPNRWTQMHRKVTRNAASILRY
jgi:hypothetical protein